MDSVLRIIISTSLVIAVFIGILTLDVYRRNDLILPRTFVGDLNLGGMSKSNARIAVKDRLARLGETPIALAAENTTATAVFEKTPQSFTLNDLGTLFDDATLIESLPTASHVSQLELIIKGISGHRYSLDPAISRTQLEQLVYKKFPTIPPSKNAYLKKAAKGFEVAPAEIGLTPNVELLASTLEKNLKYFEAAPLTVTFSENLPSVQMADLEPYLPFIQENFPKTLTLATDTQKWSINFRNHPEWIRFEKPELAPVSITTVAAALPSFPYVMYWDPVVFNKYVDDILNPELGHKPEDVRIYKVADAITVEGKGVDGSVVDRDALHIVLAKKMNQPLVTAEETGVAVVDAPLSIPMRTVAAKLDISPELQELGITELLVDGYTTYDGSPPNRQHNIRTGVEKYNGIMVAKDEEFSFNKHIGPVDGEHGFLKELVIKPEGTIPEFGGGLCQVSTTLYRAALYAGLPILKRSPHSYAVQYYAQVGGHGLDATVYPPNVDIIFKNDTGYPIIIQAYTEGTAAHFKLYGTKDSRSVTLDGPYISNKQSAPSAPLEVPDKSLKPGQRKQVEKAHGGFDALWYRTIVKDGVETKEAIKSRYRAVPNKFLVGGPVVAPVSGPADVNPFE